MKYITQKGDTFDSIALAVYGDEFMAETIIKANFNLRDVIIFKADVTLNIPIISEKSNAVLPPWYKGENSNEN